MQKTKKAKLERDGLFELFTSDLLKIIFSHLIPRFKRIHFDYNYHFTQHKNDVCTTHLECSIGDCSNKPISFNKEIKNFLNLRLVSKKFKNFIDDSISLIGPGVIDYINIHAYEKEIVDIYSILKYISIYFLLHLSKKDILLYDWFRKTGLFNLESMCAYKKPRASYSFTHSGLFRTIAWLFMSLFSEVNINNLIDSEIDENVTIILNDKYIDTLFSLRKHASKSFKDIKDNEISQRIIGNWRSYKNASKEFIYDIMIFIKPKPKEIRETLIKTVGVEKIIETTNYSVFDIDFIFETDAFKDYAKLNSFELKQTLYRNIKYLVKENKNDRIAYKIFKIIINNNLLEDI